MLSTSRQGSVYALAGCTPHKHLSFSKGVEHNKGGVEYESLELLPKLECGTRSRLDAGFLHN